MADPTKKLWEPPKPTAPALDDNSSVSPEQWEEVVRGHYGIPKGLWHAMSTQESGGNYNAVSPTGVRGKFQVTKATAKQYGLDRDDPYQQAVAAAKHLRSQFDALNSVKDEQERWLGAVGRYYAGNEAISGGGTISSKSPDGVSNPQRHLSRVAKMWGDYEKANRPATQPLPATPLTEEQRVAEQNAALKAKAPKPAPEGSGAFLRGFDKLRGNAFEKLASDSLANVEAENTRGQIATQQAIQRQRGTVDITKPQRSATMDRRLQENKPVVPRLTAQAIQNNVRQPDVFGIEGRSEGPRTKPPVDRLARQRQQMEARDRQPYVDAAQNGILAPYLQEFQSYGWNTKPLVDNVAGALQSADRIINQPIDVQETARRAGAALQKLPGAFIQGAANLSDALGDSGLRVIPDAPRLSEPVRTRVQQANRQIDAEMGVNPDAPSSLATVATEGAISSLPYLATGAVGAGMRGVAAMGALQNTGQTYEDVRARGGAPDIALQTAVRSAPIGALEGLMGTEAALAKAGVSPGLVRQFGAALRAAPPDLAQEVTSQVLNNLNQDRPVLEGTVEAAIGSLATSGALGGGAVLGRSAQVMRDRSAVRAANMQEAARLQQEAAQQQQELAEGEEILRQAGEQRRAAQQPAQAQPQPQAQAGRTTTAPVATAQAPVDSEIASFLDAIAAENGLTPRTQGKAASNKVSTEARYQEASQVAEDTRAAFEQAQAGADKEAFATTKAAHLEALRAKKSAAVDLREKTALASEIARVEKAKGGTGKAAASTPVTAPPAAPDALTPGQVRQVQAKTGLSYQEIMALPAADMRALLAQPATPVQARSLTDIRNDARLRDAGLSPEEIQALTPQEKAQLIPPRPTNQNPPPNPGRDTAPRPTNPNSIGAKLEAMRQAKAQAQTPQPAAPAQPSVASRPGSPSAPQSSTAVPVRATTTAVATAAPTGTAAATRVNRPLNIPERARLIRELGYSAEDLRTKTPDEWREVSRQGTKKPLPSIAPQNVQRGDFFTHSAVNKGEPVRVVARDEKGIKIEFPNGTQKRIPSDSFVLQEGTFTRPAATARPVSPVAQPVRGATVPAQNPQTVSENAPSNVVKLENERTGNPPSAPTVQGTQSPRLVADAQRGADGGANVRAEAQAAAQGRDSSRESGEIVNEQQVQNSAASTRPDVTQGSSRGQQDTGQVRAVDSVAAEPVSRESDIYRTKGGTVSESQLAAVDARAEKRSETSVGTMGQFQRNARRSFDDGETPGLAYSPELQKMMGLPELADPDTEIVIGGKKTKKKDIQAQHVMDALADVAGVNRSSNLTKDGMQKIRVHLTENGASDGLLRSFEATRLTTDGTMEKAVALLDHPDLQTALEEADALLEKSPSGRIGANSKTARTLRQVLARITEEVNEGTTSITPNAITEFAQNWTTGRIKSGPSGFLAKLYLERKSQRKYQDAQRGEPAQEAIPPQPATNEPGTADRASDAQQPGQGGEPASAEPNREQEQVASVKMMLTRDDHARLRELGYNETERNAMTPQQGAEIIASGTRNPRLEAQQAQPAPPQPATPALVTDQPARLKGDLVTDQATPQQLEERRQQILDLIATKKRNGQQPPQAWLDRLAAINEQLAGQRGEAGLASNPVFGHPQATNIVGYENLIPIKATDAATIDRFSERANAAYAKVSEKIGKNEAVASGRVRATAQQIKAAKAYLKSQEHSEDVTVRDLLRDETLPELARLKKQLENSPPQPATPDTAPMVKPETQPTKPGDARAQALYDKAKAALEKGTGDTGNPLSPAARKAYEDDLRRFGKQLGLPTEIVQKEAETVATKPSAGKREVATERKKPKRGTRTETKPAPTTSDLSADQIAGLQKEEVRLMNAAAMEKNEKARNSLLKELQKVQTALNPHRNRILATPEVQQQVAESVNKEKISDRTGLTKTQASYLQEKVKAAIPMLTEGKLPEVTIPVPGDGEFRVRSEQQAKNLLKRIDAPVLKLDPAVAVGKWSPPASKSAAVPREIGANDVTGKSFEGSNVTGIFPLERAAKTDGWAGNRIEKGEVISDGETAFVASALSAKDAAAFRKEGEGRKSAQDSAAKLLADVFKTNKIPLTVQGATVHRSKTQKGDRVDSQVVILTPTDGTGSPVIADAAKVRTVLDATGATEIRGAQNPEAPISFYKDGKGVAVVMPLRGGLDNVETVLKEMREAGTGNYGPTKSLGSGINPFEEARQIAGGVKAIAKAITRPREKSKTLVAFPEDFTMTKWTEEMKTASGKRKHDEKSRTEIKDLIREAYTAYKDDDFGRFLAVEKDLQDVLRSRSMNVVSAANTLTRAASLSGEVSYIGRQGGIPAVTDTRAWARSVKNLFTKGAGFTKESYFNNVARLLSDPAYGAAKEAGVDFALEHEFAANAKVLRREENALSGRGERLGRAIGLTQLEQVNKAFIDSLRLQMFKDRAIAMGATGKWADLTPRQQQRMKEMAKEINRFSGRGNINEKAQEYVDAAGFLATSARFTISRFQSVDPTKIARAYIAGKRNGDYAAANRMLRDYAKIAAFPLMIGMGLSAMGWEIGSDPDDENFLKAKKGNRHVDILPGGVTSAVKITARLAKRAIEMGKAGKDEEARMAALEKAGDQSVKFLRYKLAPLPSLVVDQVIDRTEMTDKATGRAVSYGKNAIGEPKTFNQSLWDRLHPIAWDNIGENLQKEGAVSLLATWWELIGHNASIYEARGQRMEGAETQKGFIQRETRLENGKLSQEPIADYQQRVEVGTRLLSRYRAMLDASDLYKNASPEQQARMRERLEDRVRRATKQETPNEANLTPADIAKDLRSGDKRNATQDRRLKPFYR